MFAHMNLSGEFIDILLKNCLSCMNFYFAVFYLIWVLPLNFCIVSFKPFRFAIPQCA
ncbi:hypothetical protein VCHA50O407_150005 [Vibrio chagasii]|nr:hypothetical protein VCHA27O13_140005 [Vibrio chagasii]CAH6798475.1 hypothetical protein VCHA34P120_100075 [Vibrio chagasii]CAH6801661.1 hypothetical protein VCHA34P112_110141 [Vibrio chagasii]CAH6915375.1 hypothetical protein VCHA56P515_110005 [Vibrio chagasii]CAH6923390.1 hypothetical protein VCHA34P116_30202 [Vibrio chagasii]